MKKFKKRKKYRGEQGYRLINGIVAILAVFCFLPRLSMPPYRTDQLWLSAAVTAAGFSTVLLLKAVRIYLITLHYKIETADFIGLYLKTAFINMLLPYKTGEIFRIYEFACYMPKAGAGFLAVFLDRFYDCIPLLAFALLQYIRGGLSLSVSLIVIAAFVFLCLILYLIFPEAYAVINHFFIYKTGSRRGLTALKILEGLKYIYDECVKMVKRKTSLTVLISFCAWTVELATIFTLNKIIGYGTGPNAFVEYLNSFLTGRESPSFKGYVLLGGIILLFLNAFRIAGSLKKRRGRKA